MKYLILFILSINFALACQQPMPESEARRAISPPTPGPFLRCEEKPEEKCFCLDGFDPYSTDLIDGELIPNPDKKFARELKEKNEKDAMKAKEDKCKSFSFKGTTIAQLRQEMNDYKECK